MLYGQVRYKVSQRLYTFQTHLANILPGETVLVKDKNGFTLQDFVSYCGKPNFNCRNILLHERALLELDQEVSDSDIMQPEEETL